MSVENQIKELLAPAGKLVALNLKKDIQLLAGEVQENEAVDAVGIAVSGFGGLKQQLVLLTTKRLLTQNSKVLEGAYDLDKITGAELVPKTATTELNFNYGYDKVSLKLTADNFGKDFQARLRSVLNIHGESKLATKEVSSVKAISLNIDILAGKEYLKDTGHVFKLSQSSPGTVDIKVVYHNAPEQFKLLKWDRIENIQKSAMDIAGWSFVGSVFGNSGALAGALGANIGKDKSVATLHLRRENGEDFALAIKCDKKQLEKLALLSLHKETHTQAAPNISATDEIIKFKELLDQGILTQEEFDAKKKQLLDI